MSRYALLCLAVLAVAACENTSAPTSLRPSFDKSGTSTRIDTIIAVAYSEFNSCIGENFTATGKQHVWVDRTINGTVETDVFHLNYDDLQGVGATTGAAYHANAVERFTTIDNSAPPHAFSETIEFEENWVSQGSTPNFREVVDLTFSFDGTNYTETVTQSETCRG